MTQMLALSTSWNARRHTNGRDIVKEIKSLGFDKIELSFNLTKDIVRDIKDEAKKEHIGIGSLHNYCPIPDMLDVEEALPDCYSLSSVDNEERSIAVRYVKRTIDTAVELQASVVILHCGRIEMQDRTKVLANLFEAREYNSSQYLREKEEMVRERPLKAAAHIKRLSESLDELIGYAKACNVKIALENRYYYGEIPSIDEIGMLLKQFPNLFYWHDVGHAQNLENLGFIKHSDYLRRYKDRIIGFHLHDIKGTKDHLAIGEGEFDFSLFNFFFCSTSSVNCKSLTRLSIFIFAILSPYVPSSHDFK